MLDVLTYRYPVSAATHRLPCALILPSAVIPGVLVAIASVGDDPVRELV